MHFYTLLLSLLALLGFALAQFYPGMYGSGYLFPRSRFWPYSYPGSYGGYGGLYGGYGGGLYGGYPGLYDGFGGFGGYGFDGNDQQQQQQQQVVIDNVPR
jgi:hypothetical protein